MYEGDWRNDQRHGYGILSKISKDGDVRKVYAGDWMDGKRHGFGSNWYKDGTYYEGIFRRNIREGYGQIWYECDGYYQGTWANDQYHGEGMLVQGDWKKKKTNSLEHIKISDIHKISKCPQVLKINNKISTGNGNIYEGQFVNGKKEGKGVFYHLDSREVQEGCWKNDVCMSSTIGDIGCRRSALRPSPLRTFQG